MFDGLPDFWAQLQRTWALGKDGAQALLILSGSVQTAVERIFGSRNEPLFGRSDQMMIVQPFTTSLIGQIYSDAKPSVFVSKDLLLFYALLANEFRLTAPLYRRILYKLATGRSKRTQLQDGETVDISPYLARLENLYGLVSRVHPFGEPAETRKTRYRVPDPYLRFWLYFLSGDDVEAQIELQKWPDLIGQTAAALPAYLGRSLEDWYRRLFFGVCGTFAGGSLVGSTR